MQLVVWWFIMDGNPFPLFSVFLEVHLVIPVVFPLFHFALGGPVGCFQWTSLTICLKIRKPALVPAREYYETIGQGVNQGFFKPKRAAYKVYSGHICSGNGDCSH